MKLLEDKIKSEGRVAKNGYLSLSGFLNHGIDPAFLSKLGAEIKRKFDGDAVTKILTAEAAGIPLPALPPKNLRPTPFSRVKTSAKPLAATAGRQKSRRIPRARYTIL